MKREAAAFVSGLVFAFGLGYAGMTQPAKVIGFLDVFHWDPTLLFVMIGAIAVHGIAYPIVRRRPSPLLDPEWHVPTRRDVNPRLVIGAAIFGIGWGLAGYCPGPGIVSLAAGSAAAVVFVVSLIAGLFIANRLLEKGKSPARRGE